MASRIARRAARRSARDTAAIERRQISFGSPYEAVMGYTRAVVVGRHVWVSGTAPIMADGSDPPADAYGQTKRCLEIVEEALAAAGGSAADVVRTRLYLVRTSDFDEVARAHREVFGGESRPTNTTVIVAELVDPRWLLEIEVEAVLGSG